MKHDYLGLIISIITTIILLMIGIYIAFSIKKLGIDLKKTISEKNKEKQNSEYFKKQTIKYKKILKDRNIKK